MKKTLALILAVIGSFFAAQAGHIAGGELYYRYKGPGTAPNTDRFEITLRLFRECSASGPNVAPMPTDVIIGIFTRTSASSYSLQSSFNVNRVKLDQISITPSAYPCIIPSPDICYQIGY
jgi:hypothetical protein